MQFIFTDNTTTLVLPVTPGKFSIPHGIKIETVNIHALGDVNIAGYGTLPAIKIDCMFPAHAYPFVETGADLNPYTYVQQFEGWSNASAVVRFIISETPVNASVFIEEIDYGEQDGTGDVYATLSLKGNRDQSVISSASSQAVMRSTDTAPSGMQSYTVVKGDILLAICRRAYGDASLYPKVAKYNGIKNANLIYPGQVLKLPDKSVL